MKSESETLRNRISSPERGATMLIRLLLVTDSTEDTGRLVRLLGEEVATRAVAGDRLWEALSRDTFDVVVVAGGGPAHPIVDMVSDLRRLPDRPDILVVRSDEDPVERAQLLAAGCLAVLNRRVEDQVLADALEAVLARHRDSRSHAGVAEAGAEPRLDDFSSRSPAMARLIEVAERVARSDASLLVVGETGVGKEWLARGIHAASGRSDGPFVAINCAAVPETLLESELFGHEKGAFTGADRAHRGHFERAHRGTLFLDEIGDMPVHLQSKLLRVLQERSIQRIGAERSQAVDVRVIAATNRDLEAAMAGRTFREDLYYRLGVVTLEVPPLRERREDIPPLVHASLERFARQIGRGELQLRRDTLDALLAYRWPGNVRELINVMERAVLLCPGPVVTPDDLPPALARSRSRPDPGEPAATADPGAGAVSFPEAWLELDLPRFRRRILDAVEPRYLATVLTRERGRIGRAADRAGIDPRSLYDRMRRHGLRKEAFRDRPRGASG